MFDISQIIENMSNSQVLPPLYSLTGKRIKRLEKIRTNSFLGFEKNIVGKYLSVLIDLKIIRREAPITEKWFEKSKKGVYTMDDNWCGRTPRFRRNHCNQNKLQYPERERGQ